VFVEALHLTDHFFVGSRLSVGKLDRTRRKKVVSRKFRVGKFKDDEVKAFFEAKFAEKLESLLTQCEGNEIECGNFKKFVLREAEECLGNVSSGGGNKKTRW